MTISTQDSKVNYQGNGQTTVFQIPFPFLENNQIYVQKKDAQGNLINYTYATDYTVTGAGEENGGSVTLNVAPEQGSTISIYRDVPLTQEVDYRENEIFPAETHEEALDKLTMEVQQIQEQLDRSFKVDRFSDVDLDSVINEIERVYDSTDNIDIVANNINNVNTVADNIANVNTVSGDIDSVVTTATNIKDVNTVAQNKASLNITAANIEDIKTVSSIKDDVHTVAGNNTNITAVGTNISSVNTAATNITAIQDAPNQAISAQNSATQAAQSAQTATNKADEASESARLAVSALSLQIGDIGFAPLGIDESLNLRRYLNGQVISQSQFVAFTNKVKSAIALYPNLATTEANWQTEKTNSKLGQCGKFVIDDTAGTIRLPCVVNAQGLVDLSLVGGIKSESLPNISGSVVSSTSTQGILLNNLTGAFFNKTGNTKGTFNAGVSGANFIDTLGFDASRSSSTYKNNAPVQQEAIQYPYYIQVATGVEETLPAIREYKTNVPYVLGDSQYFEANPYNASWLESNGQYNASTVYPDLWSQLQVELNSSLNVGDTIEISGKTYVKRGLPVVLSSAAYTDYDFVVNTTDQTFRLPLLNGERVLVAKKQPDSVDLGWFNLYSDGWLEQGISNLEIDTGENVIYFNKAFKDTFYTYTETTVTGSGDITVRNTVPVINKKTTTYVTVQSTPNFTNSFGFVVKGYAPIPTQSDFTEVAGLYYYVGDTVQDASLINAGAVLGQLANVNATSRGYLVDSYHNGTEWYRVWSDGWIEQGGLVSMPSSAWYTVTFLKPFSDTNYTVVGSQSDISTESVFTNAEFLASRTSSSMMKISIYSSTGSAAWRACGY